MPAVSMVNDQAAFRLGRIGRAICLGEPGTAGSHSVAASTARRIRSNHHWARTARRCRFARQRVAGVRTRLIWSCCKVIVFTFFLQPARRGWTFVVHLEEEWKLLQGGASGRTAPERRTPIVAWTGILSKCAGSESGAPTRLCGVEAVDGCAPGRSPYPPARGLKP